MDLMKKTKTGRVYISDEVYNFLYRITKPAEVDHNASHADLVRNHVLMEVMKRINNERESYCKEAFK